MGKPCLSISGTMIAANTNNKGKLFAMKNLYLLAIEKGKTKPRKLITNTKEGFVVNQELAKCAFTSEECYLNSGKFVQTMISDLIKLECVEQNASLLKISEEAGKMYRLGYYVDHYFKSTNHKLGFSNFKNEMVKFEETFGFIKSKWLSENKYFTWMHQFNSPLEVWLIHTIQAALLEINECQPTNDLCTKIYKTKVFIEYKLGEEITMVDAICHSCLKESYASHISSIASLN